MGIEMAKGIQLLYLVVIVFSAFSVLPGSATTDELEVEALQDLFKALNFPTALKRWKATNGDPCDEAWTGITCFQNSVIHLNLHGLGLRGYIGGLLVYLQNLIELDLSENQIQGEIQNGLPPHAMKINLSSNNFTRYIPNVSQLTNIRYLNLSHNSLSGSIAINCSRLKNLKELDLSYNNLTGDLPSSFISLTKLNRLYVQSNRLSGSITLLANLTLTDLNIQGNQFSGVIPTAVLAIENLCIGGNKFHMEGSYPPWDFPFINNTKENVTRPSTTDSRNYPSIKVGGENKKIIGPGVIAVLVVGGILLVCCALIIIAILVSGTHIQSTPSLEMGRNNIPFRRLTTDKEERTLPPPPPINNQEFPETTEEGPLASNLPSHPINDQINHLLLSSELQGRFKAYTAAELQLATDRFNDEVRCLGEGYLGYVHKEGSPDVQVVAVRWMKTEEDKHVLLASCLNHPNIVNLVGYCVEHGQHLLVYEYLGSMTLADAMHSETNKAFSWGARLKIALGIAQGLEFMHSRSPPVVHGNLTTANITLENNVIPRICYWDGLAGARDTTKDIYEFGVLLLELLTGRRHFDSTKSRKEQSLVNWALKKKENDEGLEDRIDSKILSKPSKTLPCFSRIIYTCIQPEEGQSPVMSEIVESLKCLINNPKKAQKELAATKRPLIEL